MHNIHCVYILLYVVFSALPFFMFPCVCVCICTYEFMARLLCDRHCVEHQGKGHGLVPSLRQNTLPNITGASECAVRGWRGYRA